MKRVKVKSPVNQCTKGILEDSHIEKQVNKIESKVYVTPPDSPESVLENMDNTTLKHAADMFIYLNSCPQSIKSWILLYKDLIMWKTRDVLVLTLNRILKAESVNENDDFKEIAKNILEKVQIDLSLRYKEILNINIGQIESRPGGNISHLKGLTLFIIFAS